MEPAEPRGSGRPTSIAANPLGVENPSRTAAAQTPHPKPGESFLVLPYQQAPAILGCGKEQVSRLVLLGRHG